MSSAPPPDPLNPQSIRNPLYACVYRPPVGGEPAVTSGTLAQIAEQFSPRYELHGGDLVSVDVSGLERLLGPAQTIGDELRRETASRGLRAHVAVAHTRTAALILAIARPGLTVVAHGGEADALAPTHIGILEHVDASVGADPCVRLAVSGPTRVSAPTAVDAVDVFKRWGLKTLGELAALPPADLAARMGKPALAFQALARGDDIRPLIPVLAEERFESTLELEWPIEELEPLSFVLTRLLEPLSTRLERRDRGAAVLHVLLRLVTRDQSTLREPQGRSEHRRGATGAGREMYARRLELPSPIRDVRTLRTLALLDLESHPPGAGVDRVTIVIDPTPGRILQHTLFTRAHPTPEQLSTLVARLGALMGHDRFGAPAVVDSYRPGAFAMRAFAPDHESNRRERGERRANIFSASSAGSPVKRDQPSAISPQPLTCALRRCRQPVPARVAVADGRPVRVTTDRRGFAGGAVVQCAGPWRTSGSWWATDTGRAGQAGGTEVTEATDMTDRTSRNTSASSVSSTDLPHQPYLPDPPGLPGWNRDEWDVSLSDGAMYRVFRDRDTDGWFIDAIVD